MREYIQRGIEKRTGGVGRACDFSNEGDEITRERLY